MPPTPDEVFFEDSGTNARYRYALDHTTIVAITDSRGTITYVNDKFCEISKFHRRELLGQNHRILNSGHHPRSFFTEMYRAIAAGRAWRGDVCNCAKDGSLYWVDTTIVPVRDTAGEIDGYIAIRADITARKQRELDNKHAAEEMEESCRAKAEFFSNMSHEIRTPMNAILGYAELLKDDALNPGQRAEHLDTISRNGEHLLKIIDDILDMSKIEAGKMSIEHIEVSPIEILIESTTLLQIRADGKALPLDLEFETPIPRSVKTDPVRVRQILINLIGNAIKFTEIGGVRVLVGLEDSLGDNPTLRIEVADTGIGMTKEQAENLFQAFQQADTTTTRRFGGTGLGLHITHRLTEMLGGETIVHSELGVGSSFIVRIPTGLNAAEDLIEPADAWQIVLRKRASRRAAEQGQRKLAPLQGVSVLLAEDGPDNQRLLSHFIRKAGGEVHIAGNGLEALRQIEAGKPFDVILMDVQMPQMDGMEATRRIRKLGCDTPIVALTAHARPEDCDQCLSNGCADFVTKPISRGKLIEVITRWANHDSRDAA